MNGMRLAKIVGITVGVLAAVAGSVAHRARPTPRGVLLPDCDGAIGSVVIQYVAGADFAPPIYREFLQQLPADVRVYAVCPEQVDFDELSRNLGSQAVRLTPVLLHHAMTAWSRDRWIALRQRDGKMLLSSGRAEASAEIWPARLGDERAGADLAGTLAPAVSFVRSSLYFDGGDFAADDRTVFVAPGAIARNVPRVVADQATLLAELAKLTGLKVVLLPDAPNHHAGMFVMPIGNGTVLVGDPHLGKPFAHDELPGGADFTPQTQGRFDSVATAATVAGYRVVRIPTIPAADGRTFVTYVNVIMDQRQGKRIVYLPHYDGCEEINAAAAQVWRGEGFEVRPIDCTGAYVHSGSLHCLVNVLERGERH